MADMKEQHVCVKSCLKPGTFRMRNVVVESRQREKHKFLGGFPSPKAVLPLLKMPNVSSGRT
jgi:hypothetical protein